MEQAAGRGDGLSLDVLVAPLQRSNSGAEGKPLLTLRDAAAYILKLPKAKQKSPEWQTAGEALLMAAEDRGPMMHARIGVVKALNRHHVREFNPKEKEPRGGKRKLARDR